MVEGGLLSKMIPAVMVIAFVALTFTVSIHNMKEKYNFTVEDKFNRTYQHMYGLHSSVETTQRNVENSTGFLAVLDYAKVVITVPWMVVKALWIPVEIVDNSIDTLGLPYGYEIGIVITVIIVVAILFAIVNIFIGGWSK